MRTTVIILLVIGLISLSSCNQQTDANTVLKNSASKTEIFNAIANNHNYMAEFMENIQGNEHAMQMMNGDHQMMGNMMQGYMMQGNGIQTMMKDSMMMKNMMQMMMKDGKMMGNMMQMMHEKGVMSEDCMESCIKMMGDKGMDMKGMGMMEKDKKTEDDHSGNH